MNSKILLTPMLKKITKNFNFDLKYQLFNSVIRVNAAKKGHFINNLIPNNTINQFTPAKHINKFNIK